MKVSENGVRPCPERFTSFISEPVHLSERCTGSEINEVKLTEFT